MKAFQTTGAFALLLAAATGARSQDGQILTVKNKDERTVTLLLAFWPRNPTEFEFMKSRIGELKFTERSSLARIGIEMQTHGGLEVDGNRLVQPDAFE